MRKGRGAHIFVSAVFLALIAVPGLIQTASDLRDGERPRALDVFLRPPTAPNLHEYERRLERTSPVVTELRPGVQYVQWRWLADAGEKAVVGRDGWLFYRPSVLSLVGRPAGAPAGDPLPAIRSFRDQLEARGIRLLVVPVPDKESVYPEKLSGRAEGAGVVVCEPTRRLLERLQQSGIEVVDLFEVFRRARAEEPRPLYLARDTHWSPEGARLAAAAVARRVLERRVVGRGDRAYAERPIAVRRRGDLVEMLQVPWIERSLQPEDLACLQVIQEDARTPYRDAADSDVLALGDSFLRIYQRDEPKAAGFIAHLARELGRPLAAIVSDGGGATLVRQELARRPTLLKGKTLVIWEFAEREIRSEGEGWSIVPLDRSSRSTR